MLSRFSDARVLAVDDTPANLELLKAVLRRAGLPDVQTVTDPRQAMAAVTALEPDLVLLDLHMPHLDGFTLLEQIVQHAAGSYLPVLVLTADTTTDAVHRALGAGARDFLTKPFDVTEVVLRVGNLLETRALHQRLRRTSLSLASELSGLRKQAADARASHDATRAAVRAVLCDDALQMVFQPVFDVADGSVRGLEALARFSGDPVRSPDRWFADAFAVGMGHDLELRAVERALSAVPALPPDAFLAVNISPETLLRPELLDLATSELGPRLVLELTEHVPVEDYAPVLRALTALRRHGVRLAVDDTGAGYASLRHILVLDPDLIKLDISLVRGIQHDPARRALAAALVSLAGDTRTDLIAEGVETAAELSTLVGLGVRWAQGYHLGRPAPLHAALTV